MEKQNQGTLKIMKHLLFHRLSLVILTLFLVNLAPLDLPTLTSKRQSGIFVSFCHYLRIKDNQISPDYLIHRRSSSVLNIDNAFKPKSKCKSTKV